MAGWGELPGAYQGVAEPDPWEAEWALTPAAVSVHWGQQAVLDPLLVVLLELGADLPEEEQLQEVLHLLEVEVLQQVVLPLLVDLAAVAPEVVLQEVEGLQHSALPLQAGLAVAAPEAVLQPAELLLGVLQHPAVLAAVEVFVLVQFYPYLFSIAHPPHPRCHPLRGPHREEGPPQEDPLGPPGPPYLGMFPLRGEQADQWRKYSAVLLIFPSIKQQSKIALLKHD